MLELLKFSYDKMGIYLSGLCALHCLLTPISLALLPSYSHFFTSDWFHVAILALVLPLAFMAIWRGYRRHHVWQVLVFGITGGLLLIMGTLVEAWSSYWESSLTVLGSLTLISAHVINLKQVHRRACTHSVKPLIADH